MPVTTRSRAASAARATSSAVQESTTVGEVQRQTKQGNKDLPKAARDADMLVETPASPELPSFQNLALSDPFDESPPEPEKGRASRAQSRGRRRASSVSSIVGPEDSPIRPSIRRGSISSNFSFGHFKRRPRSSSIIGPAYTKRDSRSTSRVKTCDDLADTSTTPDPEQVAPSPMEPSALESLVRRLVDEQLAHERSLWQENVRALQDRIDQLENTVRRLERERA